MCENKQAETASLNENASPEALRAALQENPENVDLWYWLGLSLCRVEGNDAGIDAFSQGLSLHPFSAKLYYGRGRKNIGLARYWRCISDLTLSIRLDPSDWNTWYYRAVAYNISGNHKEAAADWQQCFRMVEPDDYYPLVDWLFVNFMEMNEVEEAKKVLASVPGDLPHPSGHGAYAKRVRLYKGEIDPAVFINLEEVRAAALQNGDEDERLELSTLLFGLYFYYQHVVQDEAKARDTLLRLMKDPFPNAFGTIKGLLAARKRGLVAND